MAENNCNDDINDDDRKLVHEVCGKYLGPPWDTINNLIIKRISQGAFNKMLLCELKDDTLKDDTLKGRHQSGYHQVIVKVNGKMEVNFFNPLHSLVINILLAEKNMAPKVLGVFDGGIISEYIQGRNYCHLDDYNANTVQLLARKLARLHTLEMPTPRDWADAYMKTLFDTKNDPWMVPFLENYRNGELRESLIRRKNKDLLDIDIFEELNWLEGALKGAKSPIVFSHSDFNRGNILVREDPESKTVLDITFIDFDYSGYNYRGNDIGRYFSCWRHKEMLFGYEPFPEDEEMLTFLDAYNFECTKILGESYANQELNSSKSLIKEAKVYALMCYILDVVFLLWKANEEKINEEKFLNHAETRVNGYSQLKEKFKSEKSLPHGFN